MQKIRITGFFFVNGLHCSLKWKKNSTNGYFRLHTYLRTNEVLIHNSFYAFDSWGGNVSHKKV